MHLRGQCRQTWICIVAVFGMLVHAGLFARHVAAAAWPTSSGSAMLLCTGHGTQAAASERGAPDLLPDAPPATDWTPCPVCVGCAPAAAILTIVDAWSAVRPAQAVAAAYRQRDEAWARTEVPPPGRGPPNC